MRILLVDDEKELVSTLAERLSLRGIDADWVASSEEALKKVDEKTYDIAVLDVKIPKISGIRLKKKLEEKCPDMKFIFITGHGSEDDYQEGSVEAGADYYLIKPVNIEFLIKKFGELIEG